MNDELFKQFKDIKDQIEVLEKQKAEIELQLFDEFDSNSTNNYISSGFRFVRMGRKSWEYSGKVALLAKEVSNLKKIEELDGTALLKKESQYIRVLEEKK